jgi:hypothetical protein
LPIESARLPIESARLPIESARLPIESARLPVESARLPNHVENRNRRKRLREMHRPLSRIGQMLI